MLIGSLLIRPRGFQRFKLDHEHRSPSRLDRHGLTLHREPVLVHLDLVIAGDHRDLRGTATVGPADGDFLVVHEDHRLVREILQHDVSLRSLDLDDPARPYSKERQEQDPDGHRRPQPQWLPAGWFRVGR